MSEQVFPEGYFGRSGQRLPTKEEVYALRHSHKRFLVRFITTLPENTRLLDVGCGSGKTIRLIQAIRPDIQISGMDITNMEPWLPEGVPFAQGTVEQLLELYEQGSFDAVVCQHVVEHLMYPLDLMLGIAHVLKPGGQLFLETPNWTRLLVPFSHVWFWNDYTHVRPFSRGSMYRLLDEHGFFIETIKTASSCQWFPPKAPFLSIGTEQKKKSQHIQARGKIARIAARAVNPLLRDVLIAIAKKP